MTSSSIPSFAKPGLIRSTKPSAARKFALAPKAAVLPASTNWRATYTLGVANQGGEGACTGCGTKDSMQVCASNAGIVSPQLSWQFAYDQARILEGTFPTDAGAIIDDALSQAQTIGVATELAWPESEAQTMPTTASVANAAYQKLTDFASIDTLTQQTAMASLAAGYPISFGLTLYHNPNDLNGVLNLPNPATMSLWGNHNLCAVDYDQNYITGLNSWGSGWGDVGWFHMTWAYFLSQFCFEYYSISEITLIAVPQPWVGPPTPGPGPSPAGTIVPPAAFIQDNHGGLWTLSTQQGSGGYMILLNGSVAGGGSANFIKWNGTQISVVNNHGLIYNWNGTGWQQQ